MKRILLWVLPFMMSSVCLAEDVAIRYDGTKAKVKNKANDSVTVAVEGAHVSIESQYKTHKLTLLITGKSDDGQLILKTAGKAKVSLDGLSLTSQEGAALWLKNKKKVEVKAVKGTKNTLTVTACKDTANHKGAVIWAKDKLLLSGKGTLNIVATGDGCRGIKTKKDIIVEELTLNVTTSGNNLGEKPFGMGGFPMPDFSQMPDSFKMPDFSQMPGFGQMPPFPMPDSIKGGFPGFPGGGMPNFGGMGPEQNDSTNEDGFQGGFGGKHKYYASTKGIASKGQIIINSGNVTVRTSTAGAEGIEGKKGIAFNGGTVDILTPDDAINANATIEFNGAHVIARSKGNDAVDANPEGGFFPPFGGNQGKEIEPSIIVRGGTVYAWSQVGSPEEGLDSDFSPLLIEGGTIFSVGGSIGDAPSVPTNETAKQPTVLLSGLKISKDEPISIYNANGQVIHTLTVPFSFRGSASIITCPAFKQGSTYTLKTKDTERTFTLKDPFTVVR